MKWTHESIQNFLSDVKHGLNDRALAMHYGVSEPAIRRARQRFAPFSVKPKKVALDFESAPKSVKDFSFASVQDNPTAKHTVTGGTHGFDHVYCDSLTALGPAGTPIGSLGQVGPTGGPGPTGTEDPLIEAAKTVPKEFGRIPLDVFDGDGWTKIGLVSDTHLACREERLDALHAQYDLFVREGVREVYHAGNIVDGYVPRINGASVLETSIDGQAMYCAREYPKRDGITTYFITGDDHEGWWQKEGFNFGAYLQMVCERMGRFDMKYIGHVEADVELKCGEFINRMKIQHPGGGSAYARSYKGQKMVESFQGGEKPAILVQGHYHVSGYSFDRNVHIVGMPGFKDQDMFTRKQHLRCEIGGVILEFKMSSTTGAITRIRPEFNMFFDRGFYKKFLPSDSVLRGAAHTIITG